MQFSFTNPKIQTLLDTAIQNCPCGRTHTLETTACIIDHNAVSMMAEFLTKYSHPVIFCDENTERFAKAMPFYTAEDCMVFPGKAHATEVQTARGNAWLQERKPDVLIACGSGSLHDITRYCANAAGLPFVSYPTAASVDGFMSGIAAMTWYGQKLSFASTPPAAVFADPRISAEAPARLTASGVGDVLGKYTSLFDWHLSHLLTGEYECPTIVALTEAALDGVLDALQNRENISVQDYTCRVLEALLVSGLAMQLTGNSRPASAAEHHMSHLWEMAVINGETEALHGEQVAVGTLAVMDTYKAALEKGLDWETVSHLQYDKIFSAERLAPVFGQMTAGILQENMPDGTPASSSLAGIRVDDIAAADREVKALFAALPDAGKLRALAESAGCMTAIAETGLPEDDSFREKSLQYAPYVRNRLTLLKILSACKITKEQ
ncbi:MAG: sn-glycerol-1-phosphate dehydrogenase [Ruminococcaceae bacterium]|nr:sn-glycerol-1-phosphate dehydrogenase [Oscillospiraceae bacterium]